MLFARASEVRVYGGVVVSGCGLVSAIGARSSRSAAVGRLASRYTPRRGNASLAHTLYKNEDDTSDQMHMLSMLGIRLQVDVSRF